MLILPAVLVLGLGLAACGGGKSQSTASPSVSAAASASGSASAQAAPTAEAPADVGKRIAVVGAGPAGLSCAHRLAAKGHDVVVYDARPKPGGLNEYGIASYKAVDGFAAAEVDWLLGIGGIELRLGQRLGEQITLAQLQADHDAVFLGMGLAGVNALGVDAANQRDAVDFIAALRQSDDLAALPVGRDVVVIGGGMTAVDAAVQARLLGAQNVTIAYRRGQDRMSASAARLAFVRSSMVTGCSSRRSIRTSTMGCPPAF